MAALVVKNKGVAPRVMEKHAVPGLDTAQGLAFLWNYFVAHGPARSELTIDRNALRFLAHCLHGFPESKAQIFQDLYVTYKLGQQKNGFFVEFGAMDGMFLSNTYYLESAFGWRGILAEPYPKWGHSLKTNRKAKIDQRCVWDQSGLKLEFVAATQYPELSSLAMFADTDHHAEARRVNAQTFMVDTISLNDLLAEHNAPRVIDYLSVDTEGSELAILRSFDFDRFQTRVITVEHNFRAEVRDGIRSLLESNGFVREFETFSKADDWYFHPGRVPGDSYK